MECVILIGVPGAGKSTFYERRFAGTHMRINLDQLKRRPRELRAVQACIANGQSFVVDNTNLLAFDRARYIPLARAAGYRIKGYVLDVPLADALRRNGQRPALTHVPAHVILAMHAGYQPPAWDEGFDELHRVMVVEGDFMVSRKRRRTPRCSPGDTAHDAG